MANSKGAAKRKKAGRRQRKRDPRLCELIIIWGRNGTGKSTLAKQLMDGLPGRKLLVTKTGAPKIWRGVPVIDATNPAHYQYQNETRQIIARFREDEPKHGKNDTFIHVFDNYTDGILMMDDCMQYLDANTKNVPGITDILIEYRHRMLDVFLIVHNPNQVPNKVWDHASGVIVMSTARMMDTSGVKISNVDEIIAAQKRINRQFLAAKARKDNSQYGIYEYIQI